MYRDLVAQDEPCTIRSTNTRDIHTNFVSADASCDLESFIITIAKAKVGDKFWCRDGAQMPALLRQDPNSAGSGLPDISFSVHLHSVRDAAGRIRTQIDKHPAVPKRIVELHTKTADIFFLASNCV